MQAICQKCEPVADIKVVIFKAEPIMTTGREATVTKKRKTGNTEQNGRMIPPAEPVYHNKMEEAKDREGIVIWKRPLVTLNYFVRELGLITATYSKKLWRKKFVVLAFVILLGAVTAAFNLNGPHQKVFNAVRAKFLWCAYWVGLGVLSSVGLGTGLHTFLLYLGPHIASVTLAAYECGSLNFPSPPYPDEIICPDDVPDIPQNAVISLWSIMSKVRLEAFMWGAGTALGELPPYFMARAARMSGYDSDDEDLEELEVLLRRRSTQVAQTTVSRAKLAIQNLVEKVGFFGILACASIPNPLFDLAGITCGHFLVPFWTFFGATLIGKAVIKMHIQKMFVIIAFNEALVEKAVSVLEFVPYIGGYLHAPFREFLEKQKAKLHRRTGAKSTQEMSWLSSLFEKLVIAMVVYFVLSIVNSLAQKYHKRLCKRVSERSRKLSKD